MLTQEQQIEAAGMSYSTPIAYQAKNASPVANSDFMNVLQQRLMSTSDMISSSNTGLESAIRGAIGKVSESTSKGTQAVESQYNREIGYKKEALSNELTTARERGVGVDTSSLAYKTMSAEADKQIKDLEMRKNELMLQNDAAGAAKISDLMIKTMEIKNDAMQKTFTNLLSMGNFGLQSAQEQRAQKAQNFAEKTAIANVGLQYGIPVKEGDTLESIVNRASPVASNKQKLELAKLIAETNKLNAEANKAYSDGRLPNLSDPLLLSSAADLYRSNYADFVTKAKTANEVAIVKQAAVKQEVADVQEIVANAIKNGTTDANELFTITSSQLANMKKPMIAPKESMQIIESLTKNIKPVVPEKPAFSKDLPKAINIIAKPVQNTKDLIDYFKR